MIWRNWLRMINAISIYGCFKKYIRKFYVVLSKNAYFQNEVGARMHNAENGYNDRASRSMSLNWRNGISTYRYFYSF